MALTVTVELEAESLEIVNEVRGLWGVSRTWSMYSRRRMGINGITSGVLILYRLSLEKETEEIEPKEMSLT